MCVVLSKAEKKRALWGSSRYHAMRTVHIVLVARCEEKRSLWTPGVD